MMTRIYYESKRKATRSSVYIPEEMGGVSERYKLQVQLNDTSEYPRDVSRSRCD